MSKIETTSKVSLKPTSTINLERRRALATHRPHRSQPKQSATEAHQQDKPRKAGRAHTEAPTLDTAHNLFPPPPTTARKGPNRKYHQNFIEKYNTRTQRFPVHNYFELLYANRYYCFIPLKLL